MASKSTVTNICASPCIDAEYSKTSDKFMETFEEVKCDIQKSLIELEFVGEICNLVNWVLCVINYNVPFGKQIRGRMVEKSYNRLVPGASETTKENARVLGWCIEILQASFLVADDIMDEGILRRGQPCWYKVNNTGVIAFNDALILEQIIYEVLRLRFSDASIYNELLNVFHEVTLKTTLGQSLDTRSSAGRNFDEHSISFYSSIVSLKTSYYTVYLPIVLAFILADFKRKVSTQCKFWRNLEMVSLQMGKLFQIQDDYFDCYGDTKTIGKVGTDIEEGKCTWLFVSAKEMCSPEEYKLLADNYGVSGGQCVATVKELYKKLKVQDHCIKYQIELHKNVGKLIDDIDHLEVKNILFDFLQQVFKRTF